MVMVVSVVRASGTGDGGVRGDGGGGKCTYACIYKYINIFAHARPHDRRTLVASLSVSLLS